MWQNFFWEKNISSDIDLIFVKKKKIIFGWGEQKEFYNYYKRYFLILSKENNTIIIC